jgi:hypothetical protein
MTIIYVIPTGAVPFHTACALTEHGRWLAGAVSRESQTVVLERCHAMALRKAKDLVSGETTVVIETDLDSPGVAKALREAFSRLP